MGAGNEVEATAGAAAADRGPVGPEVAADFAEVYRAHYGRVVRALELGGLDRDAAQDTAQEAFARTLGHWKRVRTGTNPPGYVYRVAFRLSRRGLRHDQPLGADVPEPHDLASSVTTRVALEAVIAAMPPRRRSCVVLCLIVGMAPSDAGRALGIAPSTVRKQLERGRSDLRRALGAPGADQSHQQDRSGYPGGTH